MSTLTHRLRVVVALLVCSLLLFSVLYMLGMEYLEGEPRSFWRSFEWATETLTTTGYGSDSSWQHPLMVVYVSIVQFLGVLLVFLLLPYVALGFFEERFEIRVPRKLRRPLEGHLVVFGWGAAVEGLMERAQVAGIEGLVVETDEAAARAALDDGKRAIYGTLSGGVLEEARIAEARAVIANGTDEENAQVILDARQAGFEGPILALVEHPFHRQPLILAGATAAITLRHALGAALASLASRKLRPSVPGIQTLGGRLSVREMRVEADSDLVGQTLRESALGERTGVTVLGQWIGGELVTPPSADMRIEPRGILVVAGSSENVVRMEDLCQGTTRLSGRGHFVIAGAGEVGGKTAQVLRDVGEDVVVVDRREAPGVDVCGDFLDPAVQTRARIAEAGAVVLALDSDTAILFATVILRRRAPEALLLARVNDQRNLDKIHRAGADFALSLSQVATQILAGHLLGEQSISIDPHLKVLKMPAGTLVGQSPIELDLRARTGCSVVAVEREGKVVVDIGPGFLFERGDQVYVCGSSDEVAACQRQFGEAA